MAEAMAFIDDAVTGSLPDICVKDGVPSSGRLRVAQEIGRSNRLGILWLLVLAGPLGWIALLILMGRSSSEELVVRLPYSDDAYERYERARRRRRTAMAAAVLAIVSVLVLTVWAGLGAAGALILVAVTVGSVVVLCVLDYRLGAASVGVRLDASRRWVTLTGVHPAFAAACSERVNDRNLT